MSYRDNTKGMLDAMNRKRDKYLREQRRNEKHESITDISGYTEAGNNQQEDQYIPGPGETVRTYFNDDGTVKYRTLQGVNGEYRSFKSKVDTQSGKRKGLSSKLGPNSDDIVPIFISIPENGSKNIVEVEDGYEKYNPDIAEDQKLLNQGATILHSEVTLTDASGNKQTFVRRKDGTDYY
jgi:hypothetical protein